MTTQTPPKFNLELPHNFEAEQAVLGTIMASNLAFQAVVEILRVEHFADPLHGALFDVMAKLINRGQEANPFSLKAYVDTVPSLKDAGGTRYLASLLGASLATQDVGSAARVVRDAALRRGLINIASDAIGNASSPEPDGSATDQIDAFEKRLFDLAEGNLDGGFEPLPRGLSRALKVAEAAYKRIGGLSGVTTGLRSVDRLLGGMNRSDLIILAGRPSMGKTALATNIMTSAARAYRFEDTPDGPVTIDGARVGYFSLEMSSEQLVLRIIAEKAVLSSAKVRMGDLNNAEFDRLVNAAQEIEAWPLSIDDTPNLTLSAIRTRARRLKRQSGLDLLIIDYLQLIEPDEKRRNGNRVEEVSAITRGLKALAKELDVPVLALAQLSRAVEQREDKRPQLSDLRESGSIEQDADVVMFVYREEYYLARKGLDTTAVAGQADLLVEKQRSGPIGTVKLRFEAWLTKFSDLGEDDPVVVDNTPEAQPVVGLDLT